MNVDARLDAVAPPLAVNNTALAPGSRPTSHTPPVVSSCRHREATVSRGLQGPRAPPDRLRAGMRVIIPRPANHVALIYSLALFASPSLYSRAPIPISPCPAILDLLPPVFFPPTPSPAPPAPRHSTFAVTNGSIIVVIHPHGNGKPARCPSSPSDAPPNHTHNDMCAETLKALRFVRSQQQQKRQRRRRRETYKRMHVARACTEQLFFCLPEPDPKLGSCPRTAAKLSECRNGGLDTACEIT